MSQQYATNRTSGGGGSAVWGHITGTLSDQTDLQAALDAKAPTASPVFTGVVTTTDIQSPDGNPGGSSLLISGGAALGLGGSGGNLNLFGGTGAAGDGSEDGSVSLSSGSNNIQVDPTGISLSTLSNSKAVVSNSSGKVVSSATTATELGYVAGVTSAIQTQLNAKLASAGTGLVEEATGFIEAATDKTYVLDLSAAYAYTINTLIISTVSGTATAAVKINGTSVTGISAVSVSSSPATGTATAANSVVVGDKVTLVLTSSASPVDLAFTLKETRS